MKFIIGGAFQGKTDFVKSNFKIPECNIINGENCSPKAVFKAVCVKNYHILIKRLIENNSDPIEFTEKLCMENKNIIVIMNEIGCGIVPLEKSDRLWREAVGRSGCIIAENSDLVIRIFCGIPQTIKNY